MSPAKLKLINTMKLRTLLIGCFGGFIMLNSCTESPSVKDYRDQCKNLRDFHFMHIT